MSTWIKNSYGDLIDLRSYRMFKIEGHHRTDGQVCVVGHDGTSQPAYIADYLSPDEAVFVIDWAHALLGG